MFGKYVCHIVVDVIKVYDISAWAGFSCEDIDMLFGIGIGDHVAGFGHVLIILSRI
jgi:hypothetical protein